MNILIAIDSFYDGGAEIFAIRLANGIGSRQVVNFFVLRPWLNKQNAQYKLLDKSKVNVILLLGNPFLDFIFESLRNILTTLKLNKLLSKLLTWRLKYVCKKYRIDVVNSHSWESDCNFSEIRESSNFKLIASLHGHYEFFENSWDGFEQYTRQFLQRIDSVVFLSPTHTETLNKYNFPEQNRRKIFYGFDFEIKTKATVFNNQEPLKLVLAARGIKEKGWNETLAAIDSIVKDRGEVVVVDLIGTGELLDELKLIYTNKNVFNFIGHVDNVVEYVEKAHVGVLVSYYRAESLPNTIIEYLMCGKPVITTNIGAIPEMVKGGNTMAGIVLETSNYQPVDIELLKKAILSYIDNPEKIEIDSKTAIEAAQKFTIDKSVDAYLALYKNVILSD